MGMGTNSLALVLLALGGAVGAGSAMAACVGDDGSSSVEVVGDAGAEASILPTSSGKAKGTPCATGPECTSAQCSDGVCCDTTCDGICEKCNLAGTVGTCSPIPDATDPDNECPTTPLPTDDDAGAPVDAGADGGDAGADDAGAPVDAGPIFNVPDGGLPVTTNTQCAGHCNGKRACAYAGSETTCGTSFCGNDTEQGRASCDGAGHCLYGVEECSAYSCPDGSPGCKTTCAANSDCLSTFYCDGISQTCKPKLANGTSCTNVTQCASGVCDSAAMVCCNTPDCTSTPGGTCANPGAIGTCECNACTNGPCAAFYKDADGDGYGDLNGTVTNGGAVYGCANPADGPQPAGYVADHTDCFDSTTPIAKSVHPGQTAYFANAYTNGSVQSFDYDCSGVAEKGIPDNIPSSCGECVNSVIIKQAIVGPIRPIFCQLSTSCSEGDETGHRCDGCEVDNTPVFTTTVACGTQGFLYDCNPCASDGTAAQEYEGQVPQTCH